VPYISFLSPSSATAGSSSQVLAINGNGFLSSSTVSFNGTSRVATYLGSSQISISLSASDLAKAGNYSLTVINGLPGGGQASATFVVHAPTSITVPGAPTSLAAAGGNGQVGLGWDAPSSNGGAAITNYRVFRGTNSSNTLIVTSGGCASLGVVLGCTDTGLTNGQSYYYIVSAVNSAGQGPPSNGATATPTAPATPTITGISPNPVPGVNGDQTITINGSAFVSGATVTLTSLGVSYPIPASRTTFVSSSQLKISANVTTTAASWTAQVENPGGKLSNVYTFTVN
jgi:hypothetical protein